MDLVQIQKIIPIITETSLQILEHQKQHVFDKNKIIDPWED